MSRFVIGLGNPGGAYAATRHNIGFRVLDLLAERLQVPGWSPRWQGEAARIGDTWLLKPQTWMNRSGDALLAVMESGEEIDPASILVVTDDVTLPLGRLRIRGGGSSGGHNGLASVETALASRDYPRLRVGVGGAAPVSGEDLVAYVLGDFTPDEEPVLAKVLVCAADAVACWWLEGLEACQNRYNGWCAGAEPGGMEGSRLEEKPGMSRIQDTRPHGPDAPDSAGSWKTERRRHGGAETV